MGHKGFERGAAVGGKVLRKVQNGLERRDFGWACWLPCFSLFLITCAARQHIETVHKVLWHIQWRAEFNAIHLV